MKIDWKTSSGFLGKPDAQACALLLYGPDAGLARERSQMVTAHLLGKKPDPLALLEIYEAQLLEDPAKLIDELSAMSLMAAQRVILIRQAGDKLTKIIEQAASYLRKDVYIIVLADELASRSSLRTWFEKAPNAAAMACYPDEARDLTTLMRERFTQAGVQIAPEVMAYLVSQMGNDRYVTRQELEKIITYLGEQKTLSLQEAEQLTGYNRDTEADEVVNAIADRKLAQLDTALLRLAQQASPPIIYLRSLSRYFQRLYAIKQQAEHSSIESVIASLRPPVFYKQVPHLTRHAKSWSIDAIAKALGLISSAELAIKTSDLPAFAASSRKLMSVTQLKG